MIHDNNSKKFLETIGDNLRAVRIASRMEAEMVAEAIGITTDTLKQMESGQYKWEAGLIARICNYYNITPSLIISGRQPVKETILLS